jgi:hypothetical protein
MDAVAWSCTRKRAYATRGEAKAAKRRMARRKGEVFKVYFCRHCARFHIAHRRIKPASNSERL